MGAKFFLALVYLLTDFLSLIQPKHVCDYPDIHENVSVRNVRVE